MRRTGERRHRGSWRLGAGALAAAAAILIATSLGPATKSAQVTEALATATMVTERTTSEFDKVAAAREEVIAELVKRPDDPHLKSVLANLDARRRELAQVVGKFKS